MKFGNNLQHLSIPEWKSYNIDYNDLKYQIRQITQNKTSNLDYLHQSFLDNFDYINLFIQTKYGELLRKFDYYDLCLQKIVKSSHSNEDDLRNCLVEVDEIFYQIIELSIVLKNLSKFIVIQKIAIKKIFKKFLKYYPNKNQSLKFILELKNYLVKNTNSLINFDLSPLTLKITNCINQIKYERKRLNSLLEDNTVGITRKTSMFSISSTLLSDTYYQNSIFSKSLPRSHLQHQQQKQDNLTLESNFDLSIYLKKNFQIHTLIPQDSNTMNDLLLNFSIYLNLKDLSTDTISYTYLMNEEQDLLVEPSVIISSDSQDDSIIIAHIGGLRKYSYCLLPNEITQIFIYHLNDRENESYKSILIEYFQTHQVNHLTKKTIDHIISHNLTPRLKLFSKRSRYIIDDQQIESEESDDEDQQVEQHSITSGYPDNHYLITLDSEISTTNSPKYVNELIFPQSYQELDIFPHNHLAIYSNDLKLLNFEDSLETTINTKDQVILNKYSASCMRNLPKKIKSILSNNSLTLFKGLNFYQYQLSCYYNVIPGGKYINNHYTNLLEVNLLKNYENIESLNNQLNQENDLIKQKSQKIIEHKKSIKSFYNTPLIPSPENKNSLGSSKHSIFDEPNNEEQLSISPNELLQFNNDETLLTEVEDEEDYRIYFEIPESRDSSLNAFIDTLLNFKNKLFKKIQKKKKKLNFKQSENPFYYHQEEDHLDPYTKLLSCYHNNNYSPYDSINEEPPSYFHRNDYQLKYQLEYDQTLSYIYFSLNLIALFLSGIQLGIIYSIFDNSNQDHHYLIVNNVGLMIVLVMGIGLSLIFSIISINLMFYRYTSIPNSHQIISWTGFIIVALCCGWAGGLIIINF